MFEKNMNQLEGFFPVIWFIICGLYYALVGPQTVNRFEFDIYVGIILFFVSLALGYKKNNCRRKGNHKNIIFCAFHQKNKNLG